MRLKTVTLKNFRCFESLTLELHPRLTVIVGENGAGKTAVLDGIASGLTPVLTHLSSADQRLAGRGIKDADFRILPFTGGRGKEQWGAADYAQIMTTAWDGLRWDYWRPSGGSKGKEPEEKWGETALKERMNATSTSYKSAAPLLTPVFAYYGASRGRIEVPERLRSAKHNYEHPAAALVDCFNPNSDFREMLAWYDQEESSELRENRGIVGEEYAPLASLEAVRATVVSLLGDAYRNPHFNIRHKFMLERTSDGAPLLVNQLSQGYQSMLALAMDFARRLSIANSHLKFGSDHAAEQITGEADALNDLWGDVEDPFNYALAMSAPAIMLVDEIDLHLHPSWQQRVLGDLMRTFPLTQFIVTTHSPQVLTSVDASCIRKLVTTTNPETGQSRVEFEHVITQTRGVASADVLAEIMGVNPIPDVFEARQLSAYHALIQQNLHDTEEGLELREALQAHFSENHPVMNECERMIRLQAFKKKLPVSSGPAVGAS
jgi:predicted ATP-binding protein involved in virulence